MQHDGLPKVMQRIENEVRAWASGRKLYQTMQQMDVGSNVRGDTL